MKAGYVILGAAGAYFLFRGGQIVVEKSRTNEYGPAVDDMADRVGVSRAVVRALVKQESNWNPNAVNRTTGDYGLFQLNYTVAKRLDVSQAPQMPGILLVPEVNIALAEKLLREIVRNVGREAEAIFNSWNVGWPSYKKGVRSPYLAGYVAAWKGYVSEGIA